MQSLRCLSWGMRAATVAVAIGSLGFAAAANPQGLVSSDLSQLKSVGGVAASPDGKRVAYTVVLRDRPGRPYGQLWIMDLSTQKSLRVGGDQETAEAESGRRMVGGSRFRDIRKKKPDCSSCDRTDRR